MERSQYFLFVPGYYGSSLADKESRETLWVNVKEALFGRRTLALPIPGVKVPGTLKLSPQKIVEKVSLAGSFYEISGYRETLALLKELSKDHLRRVIPVVYDWRMDPLEAVRRIDRTVQKIRARDPEAEITLISHSFGSLISSYYLRYGTQDYFKARENWQGLHEFNKVVMSAAPFRGTLGMFRNMYHGLQMGLNANLLSATAYSSFPSSYFLLPPPESHIVFNADLQQAHLPLWNPEEWWKNEWGLFHTDLAKKKSNLPALKKFTTKWLQRAQKFHELTIAPLQQNPSPTPILYLQGTGSKTAEHGVWFEPLRGQSQFLFYERDFLKWKLFLSGIKEDVVYSDGDALLSATSSELTPALQEIGTHVLKSKLDHLQVLQDASSQNELKNFLMTP